MSIRIKIGCLAMLLAASFLNARADDRLNHCEVGVEGGYGYYLGAYSKYPFQDAAWSAGVSFRYRFDQRWSLLAHGNYLNKGESKGPNWNVDVCADFNFFRFGEKCFDERVKSVTPFIYCGIGTNIGAFINNSDAIKDQIRNSIYIPFGVGVKWKFAPRWNLHLAWQNNIFIDKIITKNPINLNQTGAITLGLTVEFAKEKKICRICR